MVTFALIPQSNNQASVLHGEGNLTKGKHESQEHKQVTTSTGNSQTEQLEKQSIWAHKNLDNEKSNEGRKVLHHGFHLEFMEHSQHEESSVFEGESSEKKNATDAEDVNIQRACQRVKHCAGQLKTHAGKRNKPIPTTERSSGYGQNSFSQWSLFQEWI